MTYRDQQRVTDILAAVDAIRSHLTRGDLRAICRHGMSGSDKAA